MSHEAYAAQLAEIMRLAYERGLINILGGNASVKLAEGFLITPSQVPKNMLGPDDMVLVPWGGEPRGNASMEWRMHRAIYRISENYGAVLHTHNPYTLALYEAGLRVDPRRYVEAHSIGECVAEVPCLPPGSEELAEAVGRAAEECRAVVLRGHGVVVAAGNIYEALDAAEALEDIARITLLAALGRGHG